MAVRKQRADVYEVVRSASIIPNLAQALDELVLNSIDAGARAIDISIKPDQFYIEVRDNGIGITPDEMKFVAESFASSKCGTLKEVETINTYGFRGEALRSIANISVMEIISRSCSTYASWIKRIEFGEMKCLHQEASFRDVGTIIIVSNLFGNIPARQKSLSGSPLQLDSIVQKVVAAALIQPHVYFSLFDSSKAVSILRLSKTSQSTPSRARELIGSHVADKMTQVCVNDSDYIIGGHLSPPSDCHNSKEHQYLYLNKRLLKRTQLHKLINKLYSNFHSATRKGTRLRYPVYILEIQCAPSLYDINLEVDKSQVEFKDWKRVLQCLKSLVQLQLSREKLQGDSMSLYNPENSPQSPPINDRLSYYDKELENVEFNSPINARTKRSSSAPPQVTKKRYPVHRDKKSIEDRTNGNHPTSEQENKRRKIAPFNIKSPKHQTVILGNTTPVEGCGKVSQCPPSSNLFKTSPTELRSTHEILTTWKNPCLNKSESRICNTIDFGKLPPIQISKDMIHRAKLIGQANTKFLVVKIEQSLYVIDQHAADERCRLEELEKLIYSASSRLQNLNTKKSDDIHPITQHERELLEEYREICGSWGWNYLCQMPGPGFEIRLITIPLLFDVELGWPLLQEFLAQLESTCGSQATIPGSFRSVLASKACRGAIMFGHKLTREQCKDLLFRLSKCSLPFQCAHGRPSLIPLVTLVDPHLAQS